MAEALGIASSIIALLQLTAKATSLSYEYINGVKRAPENVKKFIDELNHITEVLGTLKALVNSNPGSTALEKLNDPIQGCIQEMEAILLILEHKEVSTWRKILKRAKWPLKEKENLEFISRMERHKTLLILALNVDQFTAQISNRQEEEALKKDEKRMEVLKWLYPDPFDKRHSNISGRRQKGTGQWMLETPEVKDWKKKDARSRLLWGYGIPGGGKTFLSSLMIDDLIHQAQTAHHGVAYIYFNYKEQGQQQPADVLASLVKQLACQTPQLPKDIGDLYDNFHKQQKRPTLDELYKPLVSVANSFPQTFLVFDALDECDQKTQRKELLPLFHQMAKDGMSLFLTSRGHPEDVQHSFENSPKLKLYAKDEDIASYIQQKIADSPRAVRLVRDGKCKDRIISDLKDCANGMFLLVHFHIEHICQQTTVRQILAELDKLKNSLSEDHPMDPTYDRAMQTLRAQPRNCVELALKVILWLARAKRVLTVRELQQAVSTEKEYTTYDEQDLPDRKTLLDVCASLVAIDEKGDTVRFVHYTVQEYLVRSSAVPEDPDLKIFVACTTFLSLDIFSQGGCTSEDSFETRLALYPFLDYAAKQMSIHLMGCNEALSTEPLLKFLRGVGSIDTYLQLLEDEYYWEEWPKQQTSLHVVAVLGHHPAAELILRDAAIDVNARDSIGQTALYLAVSRMHEPIVKLLVENGASAADKYGSRALLRAVEREHEPIVKLLLESGADVSAVDEYGCIVLLKAVSRMHEPIVKLLVENGASAADKYGSRALLRAVEREHEPIVKLLVENGASAADKYGSRALLRAVEREHEPIVKLLLESGADVSAVDEYGCTVLLKAVSRMHKPIVKLLLEKGTSATDKYGSRALLEAIERGHEPIVKLLLESGADISGIVRYDCTVLLNTIVRGHEPIVKLLLENGADASAADKGGSTALIKAVNRSSKPIVKLLLESGADASAVDKYGYTALLRALEGWYESIIELLLEKDGSAADKYGSRALLKAVERGHEPIVKLLLEKGADASATDKCGSTALIEAVKRRHERIIKLLLESGADASAIDEHGHTALLKAVERLDEPIVRLLLEKDASAADKYGSRALFNAAKGGHEPIVRLLLEKGASAIDKYGSRALLEAVERGHEPIVKLLLEKDADASATGGCGSTVLMEAVNRQCKPMVKLLLEKGANTSATDKGGSTALFMAIERDDKPIVKLLLENGASISVVGRNGFTALFIAVSKGHIPIVNLLIKKGANLSVVDNSGSTVLHKAVERKNGPLVKLLLEKGVDISVADKCRSTALHKAVVLGCKSIVKLLLENGADISAVDESESTPLHKAAGWGRESIFKLLLEKGADISAIDEDGYTPLQKAAGWGREFTKVPISH